MSGTPALPAWMQDLFAAIDASDADAFVDFLTDDAMFRFGSAEPANGRAEIREAVAGFFATIKRCTHRVERVWESDGAVACHGSVLYQRHDDSKIEIPFADVFEMRDGKIEGYHIFMDIGPLYAA